MKRMMLCVFVAASAMASESFVLNIPVRFNANQETAEVRITLTLDAPPAGAQLVVNGTATVNLGATQTVGGDSVTFAAGVGNSVLITYRPLSNFGGDFCLGGGAVAKDIPLRFSGSQDITEYRVTTYVVAAPDVDCSQPSKRTAEEPANLVLIGDGVAPALVATNRGRHPLDIALVLDKSGSMAGLPPESAGGATKAEILRSAIVSFLAAWKEIDQPSGGGEWSQDRIGVVFFDSSAVPQSIAGADAPANFFVQRGPNPAGPTHQWNVVTTTVQGLTPGGATTVGGGINAAMQQWTSDPKNDLSLIVVTDGMQNTAPLVQPAPSGLLSLPPVGTLPTELAKRFIPIRTIGFGVPAAVDDTLLKNIALETAGVSYIAVSGSTMFDTLALTLVSILKGNTASLAMRMSGSGPGAARDVIIDPSAERAVFLLQWNPPLERALDLEVFRPGTAGAAMPTSSSKTPQAAIQTFDLSPADSGTWKVRVKGTDQQSASVPYTLNVLFLERHLDYRVSPAGTGDTIQLRANVTYDGKPLTKLPANAIRARVQRPHEGIGNILHDTRVESGTGSTTTPSGDIQTPYDRKLAQLTDHNLIDRVMPRDAETIELTEEGKGIYSATVGNTSTPGLYAFEVVLDWDDPRTGKLHREERLERVVKVTPDASHTAVTMQQGGDGTVLVSVTPRDRFGNYVGPGYAPIVKARLNSGGTLASEVPVDRDQTGTYVFTVNEVPMGVVPEIDITVDGVAVGKPASTPDTHPWRAFIDLGTKSINAGIERPLSPQWSVEGILGYHRRNPRIWQLSIGGKRWFGTSALRPFLSASGGVYHDEDDTRAGASVGGGVLYEVTPRWGVEGVYNYHILDDSFSTVQVGVRWGF
ncbi:MAG: outer membrane beta-barrel protein [Thermoanaerobaculia bacterium]